MKPPRCPAGHGEMVPSNEPGGLIWACGRSGGPAPDVISPCPVCGNENPYSIDCRHPDAFVPVPVDLADAFPDDPILRRGGLADNLPRSRPASTGQGYEHFSEPE